MEWNGAYAFMVELLGEVMSNWDNNGSVLFRGDAGYDKLVQGWLECRWLADECDVAFEVVFNVVVTTYVAGVSVNAWESWLIEKGAVPALAGVVG